MKTFVSLALAGLVSVATLSHASAVEPNVTRGALMPANIEVIVVTAQRQGPAPIDEIDEIVVTARYPAQKASVKEPPAMPVSMPTVELAAIVVPKVRL